MDQRQQERFPLLGGAKRMTELKVVLDHVLERIYAEFDGLVQQAVTENDANRKRLLLSYLHSTKQQLLRLFALVNWCNKAKALAECVDHDKVLDKAATHAKMLQSAADDMFAAHAERAGRCNPMFDVQTALEVLTTGCYQDLPSSIEKLRPAPAVTPTEREAKLRRITHLLHSHLLKVVMPDHLHIVSVSDGCVVVRAEGLYEAKLTLVPAVPLPEAASKTSAQPAGGDTTTGAGAEQQPGQQQEASSGSSSKPVRWRWLLLGFIFLTNTARGPPLQEVQISKLLQDLNNRIHLAADAAVYKKQAQAAGTEAAAAAAVDADKAQPAASPLPGASQQRPASTHGSSGVAAGTSAGAAFAGERAALNLKAVEQYAADEHTAPLLTTHVILTDIASRLLVDAAVATAQSLTASGGRWEGHATLHTPKALRPGLLIKYWTRAVPLTTQPDQAAAPEVLPAAAAAAGARPSPPSLEIGVNAQGIVEVLHTPVLAPPTMPVAPCSGLPSPPFPQLELDSHTVNVDELLLRAASCLAFHELTTMFDKLQAVMEIAGLARDCQVQLTSMPLPWIPATTAAAAVASSAAAAAAPSMQRLRSASRHSAGSSGAVVTGAAPADAPQANTPQSIIKVPVLEFYAEGLLLVKVSKNLFSGRLKLQPGPGLANDVHIDALAAWSQREDDLNQVAHAAFHRAGELHPAGRALAEVSARLCHLFRDQFKSLMVSKCVTSARRLRLHLGGPRALVEAYCREMPWSNISQHYALWSFEPSPFPANYPPLYVVPSHTDPSLTPRSLMFVLGADHPTNPHAAYTLLICSCTVQSVPLKLIKAVRVPPQVYRLAASSLSISPSKRHHSQAIDMDLDRPSQATHPPPSTPNALQQPYSWRTPDSGNVTSPTAVGPSGTRTEGTGGSPAAMGSSTDAARDVAQELAAVVGWCHKRIVWEKLLYQFKALQVQFVEVSSWQEQHLSLKSLAGIRLPCFVARRDGASPPCVSITSVDVYLGPDGQQGSFTAKVQGCFFTNRCTSSSTAGSSSSSSSGGGGSGSSSDVSELASVAGLAASGMNSGSSGSSSSSSSSHGQGVISLTYYSSWGHSGLDLVTDLLALIRMQTFLARLELMATASECLQVVEHHASSSPALQAPCALPNARNSDVTGTVKMEVDNHPAGAVLENGALKPDGHTPMDDLGDVLRPSKKARIKVGDEHMTLPNTWSNGHVETSPVGIIPNGDVNSLLGGQAGGLHQQPNGLAHHHHHNHATQQAAQQDGGRAGGGQAGASSLVAADQQQQAGPIGRAARPSQLSPPLPTWRWPQNGTVSLMQYSYSSATIQYTSPIREPAASSGMANGPSGSALGGTQARDTNAPGSAHGHQACINIHVRWRAVPPKHWAGESTCTAAAAAATAAPAAAGTPAAAATHPFTPPKTTTHPAQVSSFQHIRFSHADMVRCHMTSSCTGLPPECFASLEDMAQLGEEGVLLDAMAITCWPMLQVHRAAQPSCGPASCSIAHVATRPPFQHRLLARVAQSSTAASTTAPADGAAPAAATAASSSGGSSNNHVIVDISCMAVGKTWLKVSAAGSWGQQEPSSTAAATASSSSSFGHVLDALRQRLAQFGNNAYIARSWTCDSSNNGAPSSLQWGGWGAGGVSSSAQHKKHLWVLADNSVLGDVLTTILRAVSGHG